MTLEQFLAWEERQELRYEFDGVGPVARTGDTAAHAAIQLNLLTALTLGLRGKPCRPYGSQLKVEAAGRIRYPDAFVVCTPIAPAATVVREPVVVFEVLGESTASTDLVTKIIEYRATPSIRRYVVLRQDAAASFLFSRRGGEWVPDFFTSVDDVLRMPEVGVQIPLGQIYEGVEFPDTPEGMTAVVG